MVTIKFKTNIRCSGCKAKVANMFKEEPSIAQWDVDLNDPDRTLTVEGDNLNESRIIELIKKAGYEAVRI